MDRQRKVWAEATSELRARLRRHRRGCLVWGAFDAVTRFVERRWQACEGAQGQTSVERWELVRAVVQLEDELIEAVGLTDRHCYCGSAF